MTRFRSKTLWSSMFASGLLACGLTFAVAADEEPARSEAKAQDEKQESAIVRAAREAEAAKSKGSETFTNEDLAEEKTEGKVYTNEDLSRMFGSSTASSDSSGSATTPSASMGDPLKAMEQQQQQQLDKQARLAEARAKVASAEQRVKNLEVQVLATRNPFSARPQLSEEEKERRATSGEDAEQRNQRTQEMLDEAKAELAEARAELAAAERR